MNSELIDYKTSKTKKHLEKNIFFISDSKRFTCPRPVASCRSSSSDKPSKTRESERGLLDGVDRVNADTGIALERTNARARGTEHAC